MINVAALDPATLALWYDPTLLGPSPGYETVSYAVHGAIFGDNEEVQSLLSAEGSPEVARRAAYLASTIWHEKRHFLDLILTNYGAFRVRQFLSLYVNQPQVLYRAQQAGGELYLPLTAYADPVESSLAGVSDPSGIITLVAQDIRGREDAVLDDRECGARTPWGDAIELGGHAQLEALANIFQVGSTQFLLGPKAHLEVNQEIHKDDPNHTRYRWPLLLANAFGLQGFKTADGIPAVNLAPMAAVLLATLAMRGWGQKSDDEFKRPIWPATRLLAFLEYFRDRPTALHVQNARQAWDVVNDAARQLFGRTVIEELKVDLEFESKFVKMVVEHDAGPCDEVKTVCQEFHDLRCSLVGLLEEAPEGFLDPETFAHGFLPRLHPLPVQIFPSAQSGPASGGWSRLLGFDAGPLGNGCHAVVPEHWPPDGAVAFANLNAWAQVVEQWAPLAKPPHLLRPGADADPAAARWLGRESSLRPCVRVPSRKSDPSQKSVSRAWRRHNGLRSMQEARGPSRRAAAFTMGVSILCCWAAAL